MVNLYELSENCVSMQDQVGKIVNRQAWLSAALQAVSVERKDRCRGMTLFRGSMHNNGMWCGVQVSEEEACDHALMMPSLNEAHLGFAF